MITDFIASLCFEAYRSAQYAGRQKIKLDDIKFACRKNPVFLGKIEEMFAKKNMVDAARKTMDVNDDKVLTGGIKEMANDLAEQLGSQDDDSDDQTKHKSKKRRRSSAAIA